LLTIGRITVQYGKAIAVNDVSLEVPAGEIVCIIGANGSGKSTIMRAISGLVPLTSGEIRLNDRRIDQIGLKEIIRRGITHVPEGRRLFPYLTVLSNLKLGASLRKDKADIAKDVESILERFPVLKARGSQKAGTLSGGEQQMLAIARGLMAKPKLLTLDEPSIGLAPLMVKTVGEIVVEINQKGVTILLVEQNISLAFGVAKRGYALQVGRVVIEGNIDKLRSSAIIKKAYLGE
jgi:branched-chain amino acid transport system ATP-binding protein